MAEGFNKGIRGPQVAPGVIDTPAVFQEAEIAGGQMDWTLQENKLFQSLATAIVPAINKWKALNIEAKQLKADKVEFEYKRTLDEYNAFVEATTNKELWGRIIGTAPTPGRRPTFLPGVDDNDKIPKIVSWAGSPEEIAERQAEAAAAAAVVRAKKEAVAAEVLAKKARLKAILEADPQLASQYVPEWFGTGTPSNILYPYSEFIGGQGIELIPNLWDKWVTGKTEAKNKDMEKRIRLLDKIEEEEKQKQRDAGYPEYLVNGETRRYIEAMWAILGKGSYQSPDDFINSWRTP
jgi:hypothetical protein